MNVIRFRQLSTIFQLVVVVPVFAGLIACQAVEPTLKDVQYATASGRELLLDFYRSDTTDKPANGWPLIVWIHGGAWRSGSKANVPIIRLLQHDFAIASVDYRLSPVAQFPAQIHDIKAAIRFLRANSKQYELDTSRVYIAGASAGGHLAALVGVSNGLKTLEGSLGECQQYTSDVQAIISFYGASNLQTILSQSTPHGLSVRVPALQLLLGGQPEQQRELAVLASPVTHVDESDPPLLLIHGDQDPQMPINQSHELQGAYQRHNLTVDFDVIHGGVHGGDRFYEDAVINRIAKWLKNPRR